MIKSSETMASIMTEEGAIRDRENFVHNLGWLLSQTRDGLLSCELVNAEKPSEYVLVTYKGGYTKKIGTYADSYAAIVRDVAKKFQ